MISFVKYKYLFLKFQNNDNCSFIQNYETEFQEKLYKLHRILIINDRQ